LATAPYSEGSFLPSPVVSIPIRLTTKFISSTGRLTVGRRISSFKKIEQLTDKLLSSGSFGEFHRHIFYTFFAFREFLNRISLNSF
jgi:hypothetical protein